MFPPHILLNEISLAPLFQKKKNIKDPPLLRAKEQETMQLKKQAFILGLIKVTEHEKEVKIHLTNIRNVETCVGAWSIFIVSIFLSFFTSTSSKMPGSTHNTHTPLLVIKHT